MQAISFCQILKDNRITKTQKYMVFVILALDAQQNHPDILELPLRSLDEFDLRGHGNIKSHLERLKNVGYLLDIGWTQRSDGHRVTFVKINREFLLKQEDKPDNMA